MLSPSVLALLSSALLAAMPGLSVPQITERSPARCDRPAAIAPLAALPTSLVLAPIDLGPMILVASPHSVLAAPYHRDVAGNLRALDLLEAEGDVAARLRQAGIGIIALCPDAPQVRDLQRTAPRGLAARLLRGETVPELAPVAGSGRSALAIWRVTMAAP
jgi:hypothetical protein